MRVNGVALWATVSCLDSVPALSGGVVPFSGWFKGKPKGKPPFFQGSPFDTWWGLPWNLSLLAGPSSSISGVAWRPRRCPSQRATGCHGPTHHLPRGILSVGDYWKLHSSFASTVGFLLLQPLDEGTSL